LAATTVIARAFSIIGHPVVLTPVAAVLAAISQGAPARQVHRIALLFVGLAALVLSYSWLQVVRGRWSHVDASVRTERRGLNLFLVSVLAGGALLAVWYERRQIAIALTLSAAVVLVGMVCARWLKMSLHVAFAAFSTALVWPQGYWVAAGIVVTGAVAWSRFTLARHSLGEIVAGLVLGSIAGVAFHLPGVSVSE
jgi:hypothetical protein